MLVSIIVPIYKGKKYIPRLIRIIENNKRNLTGINDIELIFVNDYPEEAILERDIRSNIIETKLVNNAHNSGIHRSRLIGLENASGEYVVFLDQDDVIKGDYVKRQLEKIKDKDIVVCNGIVKTPTYRKLLYRFWFMQITVKYLFFYTKFGCRIVSPGQCMIRKNRISEWWKKEIILNNGSDDFFLWLLMLSEGKKFTINRSILFEHIIHTNNTSNDNQKIIDSVQEIIKVLEKHKLLSIFHINLIRKQITKEKSLFVKIVEKLNKV